MKLMAWGTRQHGEWKTFVDAERADRMVDPDPDLEQAFFEDEISYLEEQFRVRTLLHKITQARSGYSH